MTSAQVRECNAEAWLSGSNFPTDLDDRDVGPYYRGLQLGRDAETLYIGIDGSWRANMKDGRAQTSSEKIGVTANTRWLYQGFLDSRVQIIVLRWEGNGIKKYDLKVTDGKGTRVVTPIEDSGRHKKKR